MTGSLLVPAAIIALVALIALLEIGMTALAGHQDTHRGRRVVASVQSQLVRARRTLDVLRAALLLAVFVLAAWRASLRDAVPAVVATAALALVLLLEMHGRLRSLGARLPRAALPTAWIVTPLLTIVERRRAAPQTADPDEDARVVDAMADELLVAPGEQREMVRALLGLDQIVVDDIMVPRSDIVGIDADDDWDEILAQLARAPHTRLPLYHGDLDRLVGVLHMKRVAHELARGTLDRERLVTIAAEREARFVPTGTSLQVQLGHFRGERRRLAFVVDEYGDVQGLVALEDILEEIVGEFTTQPALLHQAIHAEARGSYVIAGSTPLRTINRRLGWKLPTDGPRTLSGAIVEYLETIPQPGIALQLYGHAVEVLQTAGNTVRTARLWPAPAGGAPGHEETRKP